MGQTGNDHEARAEVGGSLTDRSNAGLGRPNPLRLLRPLRDANGNLLHHSGRPVEVSASPIKIYSTLILGADRRLAAAASLDEERPDIDRHRRHAGVHPLGISACRLCLREQQ
jgi:hypothetical protein